jgi:DNA-binding transcriptional ArsR family regulator
MRLSTSEWLDLFEAARTQQQTVTKLCEVAGVSRQSYYRHLRTFQAEGEAGLRSASTAPLHSPARLPAETEALIVTAHEERSWMGARRLRAWLHSRGLEDPPAVSTIQRVLDRCTESNSLHPSLPVTPEDAVSHAARPVTYLSGQDNPIVASHEP